MFASASSASYQMAYAVAQEDNKRVRRKKATRKSANADSNGNSSVSSSNASLSGHSQQADLSSAMVDMRNESIDTLLGTAAEIIDEQIAESQTLTKASSSIDSLPHFAIPELTLGRVLGRGGFCVVREIEKIRLLDAKGKKIKPSKRGSVAGSISTRSSMFSRVFKLGKRRPSVRGSRGTLKRSDSFSIRDDSIFENDLDSQDEVPRLVTGRSKKGSRIPARPGKGTPPSSAPAFDFALSKDFIAANSKGGKYVLKRVCVDLKHDDKITFMKGTVDLAMEANFLAAVKHPNIIPLVGVSDKKPSEDGYFIVLEKLQETLTKRFKTWSTTDRTCKGITGAIIGSKQKSEELMRERLEVAFDIANGAGYLHRNRIIFRDLKPDNIGFDTKNVLKLFDFGLAKELNEKEKVKNGLYRMTGMTGAMRYMAPEVGLNKPYNLSADVYSWAMIMWYILALEPPFGFYTQDMIQDRVFVQKSRPAIFKSWPVDISNLMQRAWHHNIASRPTFDEISTVLRQEMFECGSTVAGSSIGGD